MRISRLGAALAIFPLSVGLLSAAQASTTSAATPTRPGHAIDLQSLDAVSATDIWAVGGYTPPGAGGEDSRPSIKHYDGHAWHNVPNFAGRGYLYSVSASATDDVWAVGEASNQVLMLHWDGTSWKRVSTPTYPGTSILSAVHVIAPDYAVATGVYYVDECPCTAISLVWNGSVWSENPSDTTFYDVSALSPTDAWGAGSTSGATGDVGVVAHWNGTRWAETRRPPLRANGYWIAPIAADDLWLTGMRVTGDDSFFQHWNGHRWTEVADSGLTGDFMTGISASGPNDVWATGYLSSTGVLEHWDGHQWSNSANPGTGRTRAMLRDVVAISSTDAWAVGHYDDGSSIVRILMHWDGHQWTDYHRPQ